MKKLVKATFLTVLTAGLIATAIGPSAVMAQDPATTNTPALPPSFRTPLIRDMDLIDRVKALSVRVADLEARNTELAKRLAELEVRLGTIKK